MNTPLHDDLSRPGRPGLAQLAADLRDGKTDLQASMEQLHAENTTQNAALARLLTAFPANDIEGHRRYHESVIEWRELRNKLVREALTKMIGAGALAASGWLAYAIFQAAKITVTR